MNRLKLTIRNERRGTSKTLVVDRATGRLSLRQVRDTFRDLEAVPGDRPQGLIGEWPIVQCPPEYPNVEYRIVRMGEEEPDDQKSNRGGGASNLYLVPVTAAAFMVEKQGAEYPVDEDGRLAEESTADAA